MPRQRCPAQIVFKCLVCRAGLLENFVLDRLVEIQAVPTSTGRQKSLIEQIVSRFSLEPSVSGVSWEILAQQE